MRPAVPLLAALLVLLPAGPAPALGDRDAPPAGSGAAGDVGTGGLADRITKEQQEAIDRGIAWLATRQDPAGGFPTRPEGAGGNQKNADYQTAVTALSTLAFLGAGHGLRHGPYARNVLRAVEWLLAAQRSQEVEDYISFPNDQQSKMHGHGFATLALAEAYATAASSEEPETAAPTEETLRLRDLSRRLKTGIQGAVDLIQRSQATVGGWDYHPGTGGKNDHEGSVTVCQVQALLAASNRGFLVDRGRIDRAREYMKKSQTRSGGFKYTLSHAEGDEKQYTYALTAAGVVSILGLADWERKEAIDRGMAFLERKAAGLWRSSIPRPEDTPYFFYGSFYAVQAYHWVGGERWKRFWPPMRQQILALQQPDGRWTGADTTLDLGDVYPTAFSLLMLEVPVRFLSIYEK